MSANTIPRVTPADIESAIDQVEYHYSGVLTICVVTMKNGFKVTGESACAHPDLYDQALGESLALTQAKNKLWPLLGYLLREKLYQAEQGKLELAKGFD